MLRQARTQGAFVPLMGVIGGLGSLVVLWLGGRAVMEGRLTLGALVAFSTYLAYLAWPTMALGWVLAIVRRGLTAMGRIVEILDAVPAIADGQEASGPVALTGTIELRDLTFVYDGARTPALRHVSLRVPAGTFARSASSRGAASVEATVTTVERQPSRARWRTKDSVRNVPLDASGGKWNATTSSSRRAADCRRSNCPGAVSVCMPARTSTC